MHRHLRSVLICHGLVWLSALLLGATLASVTASTRPRDATYCYTSGPKRLLEMDFRSFDQTPGHGWREAETRLGCELESARLIGRYRAQRGEDLHETLKAGLAWHEAQQLAFGGRAEQAAALIENEAIVADEAPWSRLHKEATFAFLRRDRSGVRRALTAFEALPPDEQGPPVHLTGAISNLVRVQGLNTCFDKPYAVAYACTGAPPSNG